MRGYCTWSVCLCLRGASCGFQKLWRDKANKIQARRLRPLGHLLGNTYFLHALGSARFRCHALRNLIGQSSLNTVTLHTLVYSTGH